MSKKPSLRVVRGGKNTKASKAAKPDKKTAAGKAAGKSADKNREVVRLIAKGDLVTLTKQCMIFEDNASRHTGNMGELIRTYSDKKYLHRGAFGIIKKLYRSGKKNPGKLWLLLAHFDDMREKLGLDHLAKAQGQLLSAGTSKDKDSAANDGGDDESYPETIGPAREVDEAAGQTVTH